MIEVTLTPAEMLMAAEVACRRNVACIRRGMHHKYGGPPEDIGWNIHIEGACGELAVCKALNLFWSGSVNAFKDSADINRNLQVRTRSRHEYDLLHRNDDDPEDIFIHVTGKAPHFHIHGWLLGRDCRHSKWLKDYGGRPEAWFVPQNELKEIDELLQHSSPSIINGALAHEMWP